MWSFCYNPLLRDQLGGVLLRIFLYNQSTDFHRQDRSNLKRLLTRSISMLGDQEHGEEDEEEEVSLERVAGAVQILAEQVLCEREAYVKVVILSMAFETYGNVNMAFHGHVIDAVEID